MAVKIWPWKVGDLTKKEKEEADWWEKVVDSYLEKKREEGKSPYISLFLSDKSISENVQNEIRRRYRKTGWNVVFIISPRGTTIFLD